MLRELLDAWRGKDTLSRMVAELTGMLDEGEAMFEAACAVLFDGQDPQPLRDDLYARDRQVNETEWTVRKQIVEHLSVNPGPHAPASLVLMSVVKDADRVADYAKNLFEVVEIAPGGFGRDRFVESFLSVADRLRATFEKTRRAFAEEDESLAHELVEDEQTLEKTFDGMIPQLAEADLPGRQAVAYTLTARHLKRISAHLGNIASTVVMPIHKIDYYDPKWHRED
ncbi:MAG: PhoU domain-containing protein [bacterium]